MTEVLAMCHVHSDWSYDGTWSLVKLAKTLGRFGIKILLMTEHEHGFDEARWHSYRSACKKASTTHLKVIPGLEYNDNANLIHVLVWGDIPFLGIERETGDLLRRVTEYGGIAVFAHPTCREAWKKFKKSWAKHLVGVEVWNRKSDGFAPSKKALELLRTYKQTLTIVGTDFHCWRQFFPLLMTIKLNGPISEQTVLESFREKQCYPVVCGLCLSCFTHGVGLTTVELAERLRRNLLQMVRPVRSETKTRPI